MKFACMCQVWQRLSKCSFKDPAAQQAKKIKMFYNKYFVKAQNLNTRYCYISKPYDHVHTPNNHTKFDWTKWEFIKKCTFPDTLENLNICQVNWNWHKAQRKLSSFRHSVLIHLRVSLQTLLVGWWHVKRCFIGMEHLLCSPTSLKWKEKGKLSGTHNSTNLLQANCAPWS